MRQLLMSLVVVGCVGCGGPLLYAGAEAQKLCVTARNQEVPGADETLRASIPGLPVTLPSSLLELKPLLDPFVPNADHYTLDETLSIPMGDLSEALDKERDIIEAQLNILSIDIKVRTSVLDAVKQLQVKLIAPAAPRDGEPLEDVMLVDYLQGSASTDGLVTTRIDGDFTHLQVDFDEARASLTRYLEADDFTVDVKAVGSLYELPRETWAADIDLCTNADVEVDYGKKLGLTK
jgi:hypothetical protein